MSQDRKATNMPVARRAQPPSDPTQIVAAVVRGLYEDQSNEQQFRDRKPLPSSTSRRGIRRAARSRPQLSED